MLAPSVLKRLTLLALLLSVAAFLVGSWLGAQAQPIQLVRPAVAEDALFGTDDPATGDQAAAVPGTPIGSPQFMIVRSQAAFLPGVGEGGVRYVSDTKLRELGEYPLQLKTVQFFRNTVTLGLLALSALLALLWRWRQAAARPVAQGANTPKV